jgi:uncharacterized membrane protein
MITAILFAALGAVMLWQCRDDDTERIVGLPLTTATWKLFITVNVSALIYVQAAEWWQFGVAMLLFIYVLTAPHNLQLSPPRAYPLPQPRDVIQEVMFKLFDAVPGDALTWPMYWACSIVRYALPISLMGLALQSLPLIVAGPVASLIYYPWVHSERSKYVRAAGLGALLFGVLGWGLSP